jgi:hypothetical protein
VVRTERREKSRKRADIAPIFGGRKKGLGEDGAAMARTVLWASCGRDQAAARSFDDQNDISIWGKFQLHRGPLQDIVSDAQRAAATPRNMVSPV